MINGPSNMLFFNCCLFPFSKFQITIVKNLVKDFEGSQVVLLRHNFFYLRIFDNEAAIILKFFEVCMEMHFVSLFFLKERNIATSLLMIHLKCSIVHYANQAPQTSRSYWPLNMLFHFFRFLIYVYFNEAFVEKIFKITIIFLIKISKIHFKMQYITEYQDVIPSDTKMVAL